MAIKDQISKVTELAASAVHVPAAVVGTAVGLTKGTVKTVRSVIAGHPVPAPPVPTDVDPAEPGQVAVDPDKPVNVTEELGLDPSPVARTKQQPRAQDRPVTRIDADADPGQVDATPADVARALGEE